jgi:hypothetical protein
MRVGKELAALPGVADAAVVMGTKSNLSLALSPLLRRGERGHP